MPRPAASYFPTTGACTLAGSAQVLADARLTRALALELPPGGSITWTPVQITGWAGVEEHLRWQTTVPAGETVWLTSVAIPAYHGPVRIGLSPRRNFRPTDPVAVAQLEGGALTSGTPAALTLSKPLNEIINGGKLVAALYPVLPDDPIEASEQDRWYSRFDHYLFTALPVDLARAGNGWQATPGKSLAPGIYRLRLWAVPGDTPLPEAMGGPQGAVVGYFPGFRNRGTQITQDTPGGDVLVTVNAAAPASLTIVNPSLRASFWRGEPISLLVQARGAPAKTTARVSIHSGAVAVASFTTPIAARDGFGVAELRLESVSLAPGRYVATADAPGFIVNPFPFTIASPPATGMPDNNSPLQDPSNLEAHARVGINTWTTIMAGGPSQHWPQPAATARGLLAGTPALPLNGSPAPGIFDAHAGADWLYLQGAQSRQNLLRHASFHPRAGGRDAAQVPDLHAGEPPLSRCAGDDLRLRPLRRHRLLRVRGAV